MADLSYQISLSYSNILTFHCSNILSFHPLNQFKHVSGVRDIILFHPRKSLALPILFRYNTPASFSYLRTATKTKILPALYTHICNQFRHNSVLLVFQWFAQKRHGPIEVMQGQLFCSRNVVISPPLIAKAI